MLGYKKRHHSLAMGLASLAGFVDSTGFLKLGGLFVSFVSGNSTRMAVSVADGAHGSLEAAELIITFVLGVVAGALLGAWTARWRKQAILALVTSLLLMASVSTTESRSAAAPILLMTFAMGAANNVFQRDGQVTIGVTYMTGTVVKLGQTIAATIMGGPPLDWLPYLLLWISFMIGAILGGVVFPILGLHALWIASGFSGCLLAGAFTLGPLPMVRNNDKSATHHLG